MRRAMVVILWLAAAVLALAAGDLFQPGAGNGQGRAKLARPAAQARPTSTPWWRLPATATPTPTATRAPLGSGTWREPLVLRNFNLVPPGDVALEMSYFGSGGAPDLICSMLPQDNPATHSYLPYMLYLNFCWPGADANVRMTVTGPDRRTVTYILPLLQTGTTRYLDYAHPLGVDRTAGAYQVILEGAKRRVTLRLELKAAEMPAFYSLYPDGVYRADQVDEGRNLHLTGFQPREQLQVLIYQTSRKSSSFAGWESITVDENGQLWIKPDIKMDAGNSGWTAVVVRKSRVVVRLDDGSGPSFEYTCPGAPTSRLGNQQTARVVVDIPVYASLEDAVRARVIKAGIQVQVVAGPFCRNGMWWWQLGPPDLGYTLETYGLKYALEPVRVK